MRMAENLLVLKIQEGKLYLNNLELRGVGNYKVSLKPHFPGSGKAILSLKLLVEFPDNEKGNCILMGADGSL